MTSRTRTSTSTFAFAALLPWGLWLTQRRFGRGLLLGLYELSIVALAILETQRSADLAGSLSSWDRAVPFIVLGGIAVIVRILIVFRLFQGSGERGTATGRSNDVIRRMAGDAKGISGLAVLILLGYLAIAAPLLAGDPMNMVFSETLQSPGAEHILGTDLYGRDIFSRIAYGARYTLGIGLAATAFNIVLGTALGLVAGFFRGVADAIIMRLLEILNSIPFLMLAILIVAVFGSSIPMLIIVLSVFVLQPARIVRGQVLDLREKDFVQAAIALGAHPAGVLLRHILPNLLSTVLVVGSIRIGQNILSLAGLSFLGMGISPPTPSWGSMLQEGRAYIQGAPWLGIFPGLAIFVTVLAFNLFGDSLRDALDPRLRGLR